MNHWNSTKIHKIPLVCIQVSRLLVSGNGNDSECEKQRHLESKSCRSTPTNAQVSSHSQ